MNLQLKIWFAIAFMVSFLGIAIWQLANFRGARSRGLRRNQPGGSQLPRNKRRSDSRQLTSQEKKLFAEAQRLLAQGKISAGARLLEQLSMPREAIQALEDHGMIHEAARILMRMQRPNRAGVIYARYGMWEHASHCFRIANMPLEAAKCAREAGQHQLSMELFEKAERFEDAAECAAILGDFTKAGKLFLTAGNTEKYLQFLEKAGIAAVNIDALTIDDTDIERIMNHLGSGEISPGLCRIVAARNKIAPVIMTLISQGFVKQATELYAIPTSDVGPALMAEVSYQNRDAQTLAEMFKRAERYHYAGMVYEKLGMFDAAGDAFERVGEIDRAIYCYERGHFDDKVKLLKSSLKNKNATKKPDPAKPIPPTPKSVMEQAAKAEAQPKDGRIADKNPDQSKVFAMKDSSYTPTSKLLGADLLANMSEHTVKIEATTDTKSDTSTDSKTASSTDSKTDATTASATESVTKDQSPPEIRVNNPRKKQEKHKGVFSLGIAEETVTDQPPPHLPSEKSALNDSSQSDLEHANEIKVFEACRFLDDFSPDQRRELWNMGKTLNFSKDSTVLNYQESPRGLYIMTRGTVTCHRTSGGQETFLDTIGPSDSFGELWLLTDLPTTVCFRANEDVAIRLIPRDQFATYLEKDGVIARKVYKRFTTRLLKSLLKSQQIQRNQAAS